MKLKITPQAKKKNNKIGSASLPGLQSKSSQCRDLKQMSPKHPTMEVCSQMPQASSKSSPTL